MKAFISIVMMLIRLPLASSAWSSSCFLFGTCREGSGLFRAISHSTRDGRRSLVVQNSASRSPPAASGPPDGADGSSDTHTLSMQDLANRNNINDQVISAMSSCGGIKVTVATVRNLLNEFVHIHGMTRVPADALGRLTTCALLMSNGIQEDQTVQISVNGDGPLRGAVSISNGRGQVRGYVGNPAINGFSLPEAIGAGAGSGIPVSTSGSSASAVGAGKGTIQVVKNHPSWPNPYNGITTLRHGDIDRDVGIYLAESEQRSCALAAATVLSEGPACLCKAAGGYLVEQLPGCDVQVVQTVEQNLAALVSRNGKSQVPTQLLLEGVTPVDIAKSVLEGVGVTPLQTMEPTLRCECSEERLFRSIRLLPREEVDEILKNEEQIEARCHFCGRVYRMGPEEVEERFRKAKGDPAKDVDI